MDQPVPSQTIDLAIGGMTCASCVARVEKSLKNVPGVRDVSVNLATETAHLEMAAALPVDALIDAVSRAGYTAVLRAEARPAPRNAELLQLIAAALLSAPLLAAMFLPIPAAAQLVLATLVQFWLGGRFYVAGAKALWAGTGNMDLLVALGTSAAYFLSLADFASGGPLYFESSAVVITLIRLGKFLEAAAKREAAGAVLGLQNLRPATAHLAGGGDVPLAFIKPGNELELRPGERVPADAEILAGEASMDESPVTGEALPVARGPGDKILAGSLNLDAVLRLRVTAAPSESFVDRISRLIEAAQSSKPEVQKLADRVAAVFVPVVLVIAAITCAGWLAWGAPLPVSVINAVSVLVIACPCALGLATPAAILAGTGAGARHGILLHDADAIEAGAKITQVMLDKTGTLTTGAPHLAEVLLLGGISREAALGIAAALAASDTHPLSRALRREDAAPAQRVRVLPGRGVEGVAGGIRYILGSAALIADAGGSVPEQEGAASWSYLALADGTLLAGFAFTDTLLPGAREAVAQLRRQGISVTLLSGDREPAVRDIAAQLGIADYIAAAPPERKLAAIRLAQASGRKVAMLGDGINDAAALAAADLGLAIGSGADVAIEAADIALLRPAPELLPQALALCRETWAVLRQNLFWAMAYNLIFIPAAAFGLLSPPIAGAAMAGSSVSVLLNALRLRHWRQK